MRFNDIDHPDLGLYCCYGTVQEGASACTCWRPVFDLGQQPLRPLADGAAHDVRDRMCADCAYRPGSPEKSDDPMYRGDATELEMLAEDGRFYCHQGLRRIVEWVHPSGARHPAPPGAYDPPIVDGVPYRADGSPEELCAGWDARRRALEAHP